MSRRGAVASGPAGELLRLPDRTTTGTPRATRASATDGRAAPAEQAEVEQRRVERLPPRQAHMAGRLPSGRAAGPGTRARQVSVTAVGEVGRDMAGTYTAWGGLLAAREARIAGLERELAEARG